MVTERIIFSGRVQGVGFRATTHVLAHGRPVKGYVRNRPDGSVEIVAQGSETDLKEFVGAIQSRLHGQILNTDRQRIEPAESFEQFEIRY